MTTLLYHGEAHHAPLYPLIPLWFNFHAEEIYVEPSPVLHASATEHRHFETLRGFIQFSKPPLFSLAASEAACIQQLHVYEKEMKNN